MGKRHDDPHPHAYNATCILGSRTFCLPANVKGVVSLVWGNRNATPALASFLVLSMLKMFRVLIGQTEPRPPFATPQAWEPFCVGVCRGQPTTTWRSFCSQFGVELRRCSQCFRVCCHIHARLVDLKWVCYGCRSPIVLDITGEVVVEILD